MNGRAAPPIGCNSSWLFGGTLALPPLALHTLTGRRKAQLHWSRLRHTCNGAIRPPALLVPKIRAVPAAAPELWARIKAALEPFPSAWRWLHVAGRRPIPSDGAVLA